MRHVALASSSAGRCLGMGGLSRQQLESVRAEGVACCIVGSVAGEDRVIEPEAEPEPVGW